MICVNIFNEWWCPTADIEWISYHLLKYKANTDDYFLTRLTEYQDFTFIISGCKAGLNKHLLMSDYCNTFCELHIFPYETIQRHT